MRNFDLTPLFRSSIGFDRLNDLFESAMREDSTPSYPPYNIEKIDDNRYFISMAVAGFKEDDINISLQKNMLTVSGKAPSNENEEMTYLYKGIANRAFERKFNLADYMKVAGAELSDGLLRIELHREIPEEVKPRLIPINQGKSLK
ncbi:MAG: Hsp20 family protein [Alphaproteobacteria bacterium]